MSLLTKVLQYSNVIKIEWTWISTWDCHICNAFLVTSHCELHRKDGLHACGQVLYQQEGEVDGTGEGGWEEGEVDGTGEGGWGHLQGPVHMVAARLGFKKLIVETGLIDHPHPD